MHQHLLRSLLLIVILSSCASTAHQKRADTSRGNWIGTTPPVTSSFRDVDTTLIMQPDLPAGKSPVSLMDLPRTEEGAFVLSPGLYEADFKTYCLQPGTPGPSPSDVYFQAPLGGARKDMIQAILFNSRKESQLDQKNVQLLLWSVVSHSDFYKLSPEVQYTATQLLSRKQLFELQGGVLGVVKTVARMVPTLNSQNDIGQLFDLSVRSYEAFERLAVLNTPAPILRTDLKQDQWYRQEEGYYVRYLPNNYKQTRIQVYVPDSVVDSAAYESGNYLVFDPTSWVVVAANSRAQRLGIGGPVLDIVRSVIRTIKSGKGSQHPKETNKGNEANKGNEPSTMQ
ncbi:hypothetical protein OCK74_24905 [Chitinophagaceae bacterium LB-8]|jgi:hypothetical protein|uniref:DUF4136 domain-containing protein n=1 Tax=Paraflavisolibacter caeni TaxID=2982496 RepID=A0A9X3BK79_9BACT|nr:hypothetical protein [Paraflavisolibacter caeni]MCU7552383.1 hypothetical protein [Paraflavisolibacter caeni]